MPHLRPDATSADPRAAARRGPADWARGAADSPSSWPRRSACWSAWSPSRPSRRPTIPALSGVGHCQPNGTFSVAWSVGNSETAASRYMLVRSLTTPTTGTTTGLTADTTYTGLVNASYAGPGTLVAPGASVAAATTGIPGSTTGSVTLSVTGYWSYGSTVVETRTASVDLGSLGPCRSADLAVTKTSAAVLDRVNAGGLVRYTIAVTNLGPDTAQAVQVTDQLPAGSSLATVIGTDPCWALGRFGQRDLRRRHAGQRGQRQPRHRPRRADRVGTTIVNRAVVTGSGAGDPNPANNVAERSTLITADRDDRQREQRVRLARHLAVRSRCRRRRARSRSRPTVMPSTPR